MIKKYDFLRSDTIVYCVFEHFGKDRHFNFEKMSPSERRWKSRILPRGYHVAGWLGWLAGLTLVAYYIVSRGQLRFMTGSARTNGDVMGRAIDNGAPANTRPSVLHPDPAGPAWPSGLTPRLRLRR